MSSVTQSDTRCSRYSSLCRVPSTPPTSSRCRRVSATPAALLAAPVRVDDLADLGLEALEQLLEAPLDLLGRGLVGARVPRVVRADELREGDVAVPRSSWLSIRARSLRASSVSRLSPQLGFRLLGKRRGRRRLLQARHLEPEHVRTVVVPGGVEAAAARPRAAPDRARRRGSPPRRRAARRGSCRPGRGSRSRRGRARRGPRGAVVAGSPRDRSPPAGSGRARSRKSVTRARCASASPARSRRRPRSRRCRSRRPTRRARSGRAACSSPSRSARRSGRAASRAPVGRVRRPAPTRAARGSSARAYGGAARARPPASR